VCVRLTSRLGRIDGKAKLLTICDLKGVTIRIAQKRSVAHWWTLVFCFANEAVMGLCELA
jgi:hypothetical protein